MNNAARKGAGTGAGFLLPIVLAGIGLLAAGCGPSKMAREQLAKARSVYEQAKADPDVSALAPIPLAEAKHAIDRAEQTGNTEEVVHLSYLAEKKSRIAMAVAEGKIAERNTEKLNAEMAEAIARKQGMDRERVLAAERARMEAEQARQAAMTEAERAAKARLEAEQARLAAMAEAEKAARAKADADRLMTELSDLKARQTERGIVLTIGDVLFAFDKASLSPEADRNVVKLADFLKKYANRNVLIEGHTDSVGSDEYNMELSRKRADSVKEKLLGYGIDPARITTVGYGEKYPAVKNDTEFNRSLNRRVEVIILNEGVEAESQLRK
ncbi:MAG TPA: OmpA family protein [Candidatus Aquicultoraceae bacterium]|nr:OmpA family protein [Candidatus Aquicultoraceae bacterium]